MTRPLGIVAVGEAMVELRIAPDGRSAAVGYAGDTLNTAIYLRRVAPPGLSVGYATVVGSDALSNGMIDFIASHGIDTGPIRRRSDRTVGLYAISTRPDGERSFSYWRDASAARQLFASDAGRDFGCLDGADVVMLSAITLAILPDATRRALFEWLAAFRSRGGRVAFDSNHRPALWPDIATARAAVAEAWRTCDIALPSVDDEAALFGDANEAAVLERLRGYGLVRGALKRGACGPLSIDPAVTVDAAYPSATRVVDTTAAGDSFNGAFLAEYLVSGDTAAAMRAGHDMAARVVGHPGAIIPADA